MGTAAQIAAQLRNVVTTRSKTALMQRCLLILEGDVKREVKVKSGGTRRSFTNRVEDGGNRGVVGSNYPVARYLHEGTGIYGPRKRKIVPVTKKAMMYKGAAHPFRSSKGMRPDKYIERAVARARPHIDSELQPLGYRLLGVVK
jgi:hypothetical protein